MLHGGVSRVGIANMQFRSLAGAISEKGSDWEHQSGTEFTKLVRKHYAEPTHDLAKDTAKESKRMTGFDGGEELKPNKERFGELAYFESEVDDTIQRKDDPTVFDVCICFG